MIYILVLVIFRIYIENIEDLNSLITNTRIILELVQINIKNSAIRRAVHSETHNLIHSKINLFTAIKIGFLFIFAFFSVIIPLSVFNKVKINSNISIKNDKNSKNEINL